MKGAIRCLNSTVRSGVPSDEKGRISTAMEHSFRSSMGARDHTEITRSAGCSGVPWMLKRSCSCHLQAWPALDKSARRSVGQMTCSTPFAAANRSMARKSASIGSASSCRARFRAKLGDLGLSRKKGGLHRMTSQPGTASADQARASASTRCRRCEKGLHAKFSRA